jgi:5-methylthioadenosine/S-adenosylhomocysteine deaminase
VTRKSKPQQRFGCSCCYPRVAPDRRSFLFGSAALGITGPAAFFTAPVGACAQGVAGPPRSGNFVLRGGYVITMDDSAADIPIGDVHVRDGVILTIAPSVEAPGAEIVDARGMIVMPGFI